MIELKYSASFIVSTIFGLFTIFLYLVVINTIIQWRKVFNTSYYAFLIISAVLCILSYLDSWPILILPNAICKNCTFASFYEQSTFPGLDILRFFYVYLNHAITYLEILMVFNRYTAIALHFQYKKLWKKISYYPLILVFLIPVVLTYNSLYSTSYPYYKEQFDSYAIKSDESISRRKLTAACSMLALTLSVCIFGGMTIHALWKHPIFPGRSTEAKLFFHAIITAGNGTFSFIYAILTAFFPVQFRGMNESTVTEYTLLLNTCTSPYILILCSRQLRDHMPILSKWKKTAIEPSSKNQTSDSVPPVQ